MTARTPAPLHLAATRLGSAAPASEAPANLTPHQTTRSPRNPARPRSSVPTAAGERRQPTAAGVHRVTVDGFVLASERSDGTELEMGSAYEDHVWLAMLPRCGSRA